MKTVHGLLMRPSTTRFRFFCALLATACFAGGCSSTDIDNSQDSDLETTSMEEALDRLENTSADLNVCIADEAGEKTISSLTAEFEEISIILHAKLAKSKLEATDKSELKSAINTLNESYKQLQNVAPSQTSTEFNRMAPSISEALAKIKGVRKSLK